MANKNTAKTAKKKKVVCHDLKTETSANIDSLPQSWKLIPILFYVALALFVLCLIVTFIYSSFFYKKQYDELLSEKSAIESVARKKQAEIKSIKLGISKADEISKWVKKSNMFQNIIISVSRSLSEQSKIDVDYINVNRGEDEQEVIIKVGFSVHENEPFDSKELSDDIVNSIQSLKYTWINANFGDPTSARGKKYFTYEWSFILL